MAMTVRFSVVRVETGQWLDITGQLPRVHAPVLEEHVKEGPPRKARRVAACYVHPGTAWVHRGYD